MSHHGFPIGEKRITVYFDYYYYCSHLKEIKQIITFFKTSGRRQQNCLGNFPVSLLETLNQAELEAYTQELLVHGASQVLNRTAAHLVPHQPFSCWCYCLKSQHPSPKDVCLGIFTLLSDNQVGAGPADAS